MSLRALFEPGRRFAYAGAVPLIFLLMSCGGAEAPEQAGSTPAADEPTASAPEKTAAKPAEDPSGEEPYAAKIAVVEPEDLANKIASASGKVVVANYWATWCPPCVHEMPEMVKFYENSDPDEVAFLSISVDHPETLEDAVRPFVQKRELPFPVLVLNAMPGDLTGVIDIGDWAGAVPGTFVYDQSGELVKSWNEEITADTLREAVKPLLSTSAAD